MRTVILRHLSPNQDEPWEFRLNPQGKGGIVSVPARMSGYPIDWPPRSAAQAGWIRSFAPKLEARAGAAWYLGPKDWKRLVDVLDAQAAQE